MIQSVYHELHDRKLYLQKKNMKAEAGQKPLKKVIKSGKLIIIQRETNK